LGLLVTLAAVTGFCDYSLHKFADLRALQADTIDLNRHDSLLLLRIQNDVNTLGLKLQEITEGHANLRIADYRWEFAQIHQDLSAAVSADNRLAPSTRRADLTESVGTFWKTWDQVLAFAKSGKPELARTLAAKELSDQEIVLTRRLSELLEENNRSEERVDARVASIYDSAEHKTYLFLALTIAAILFTSLYLIYSNRLIFAKLEILSRQRRVLAARLISVQEEVLRSVSRELHDEFGQILTAVSAMLTRAERKGLPPDSPFRTELSEVREITHSTLEKMRSLSQMLHPAVLDDYGMAKGIEWYTSVFERQTGIPTEARIEGEQVRITGAIATHCFRIVQEALTNAAKHSGTKRAEVAILFGPENVTIHVRDFGVGMPEGKRRSDPGLGLIAMRERAEILCGTLVAVPESPGTRITLTFPLHTDELNPDPLAQENFKEVLT
jgi:signal transduction histidine kinase